MTGAGAMGGVGAAALVAAGCTGAGAAVLAALGYLRLLDRLEAVAWSFALGFGVLGWAIFFLAVGGWIAPPVLAGTVAFAAGGLVLLRRCRGGDTGVGGRIWWLLAAGGAVVITVDLMEGLAPPVDADTLAYHFALPKRFLAAGRLEFVPMAVDGAVPLLVHMTYLVVLALGGETGLTLWTMVSGWMAALLVYVIARRYMGRVSASATALLFLSVPAMLYSGGTGQVEPRLALFALAAAAATADGIAAREIRWVVLAGLAAGFFAASKYTGLLFVAACAVPLLLRWPAPRVLLAYGTAAAFAGFQWYGWNWLHTGDPVFPTLWRFLGLADSDLWTATQDALFHSVYSTAENPYPRTLWWLLAFPFVATLAPDTAIESGRVGLGPYALLVLPFALAALWRFRARLLGHPLFVFGLVAAAFYGLWFVSGAPQRVRHLLPIYPLLLICLTAAAGRFGETVSLRRPVAAAAVTSLVFHLGAQAAFGLGYVRYFVKDESRAAFLSRNVPFSDVVAPVEAAMGPGDRVLIRLRQLVYLFGRPVFYYHPLYQAQVTPRIAERAPERFLRQLRVQAITLLLVSAPVEGRTPSELTRAVTILARHGCAAAVRRLTAVNFPSRTLRALGLGAADRNALLLYRLKDDGCRLLRFPS